jgi:hypothetical protein
MILEAFESLNFQQKISTINYHGKLLKNFQVSNV